MNEQDVRGGGLPQEYALKGPQAEPPASYWLQCPAPRVLSLQEITSVTDNPNHSGYFPPYLKAVRPGCSGDIADDIDELQMLAGCATIQTQLPVTYNAESASQSVCFCSCAHSR